MELNSAGGEAHQLGLDVGYALVVEQDLARLVIRGVNRDIERREPVFQNPLDVPLFHVRQRRKISIRKRQTIVVVANVERLSQSGG